MNAKRAAPMAAAPGGGMKAAQQALPHAAAGRTHLCAMRSACQERKAPSSGKGHCSRLALSARCSSSEACSASRSAASMGSLRGAQ